MKRGSKFDREVVSRIDGFIRHGQGRKARAELRGLKPSVIPRPERLALARLAWRAGLPSLTVRLLAPLVRPPAREPQLASGSEKAEYAVGLTKIGAAAEAITLLGSLDESSLPEVSLYHAFALIAEWRYREAVPLIERYLAADSLGEYQRLVGQVNLAASLIVIGRHEEAENELASVRARTESAGHGLLFGNSLELSAQSAIARGEFSRARHFLERAAEALKQTGSIDDFFVRKWQAVLLLHEKGAQRAGVAAVQEARAEAAALCHWETVRDLDRHLATRVGDEGLLRQVYFGSPFAAFRERIAAELGHPVAWGESYEWWLGKVGPATRTLDLTGEKIPGGRRSRDIKVGQLMHGLLASMAGDFYRPFRIAQLHQRLYPDEYFNLTSSPLRIHQVMIRLRRWLAQARVPLTLAKRQGGHRLESEGLRILVPADWSTQNRPEINRTRIEAALGSQALSSTEAAARLGVSKRTAIRLLESEIAAGRIERSGESTGTRYTVKRLARRLAS